MPCGQGAIEHASVPLATSNAILGIAVPGKGLFEVFHHRAANKSRRGQRTPEYRNQLIFELQVGSYEIQKGTALFCYLRSCGRCYHCSRCCHSYSCHRPVLVSLYFCALVRELVPSRRLQARVKADTRREQREGRRDASRRLHHRSTDLGVSNSILISSQTDRNNSVPNIKSNHVVEFDSTATADLPQSGDARFRLQHAPPVPDLIGFDLVRNRRPRTNQRHLSLEYVPQLWQLVQAGSSQERPHFGHSGIIG